MNQKKQTYILYLIIVTIAISIVTQFFFNYKNYQKNKQQFKNDVQVSLDNAIDNYFAKKAKQEFKFFPNNNRQLSLKILNQIDSITIDTLTHSLKNTFFPKRKNNKRLITITKTANSAVFVDNTDKDSFFESDSVFKNNSFLSGSNSMSVFTDSLKTVKGLQSIFISIIDENIRLKKLKPFFIEELNRKNIKIPFKINHFFNDELIKTTDSLVHFKNAISTFSRATFLKQNERLEVIFPNQTKTYLKRGLLGILLSLLLSLAIISSLFYLLNIIKKQKLIADIKNDFISNITHEFKTPITTIGLALEGVKNFTEQGAKEKTKEYLDISNQQLKRLNLMVEKVLETATLDSENLLLNIEKTNLIKLINNIVNRYKNEQTGKEISFNYSNDVIFANIDAFHFENAINNIIDNAYKYGGNQITLNLVALTNNLNIIISDSGNIPKAQRTKIFDKFYRIPKGNQHDVKGFGIGLYYTKKIIEKHQGNIALADSKNTIFTISIPK